MKTSRGERPNSTRRDFLKAVGAAGLAAGWQGSARAAEASPRAALQQFNMCGYRAPALGTVRVGIIGIGGRGLGALRRLARIDGVRITALCDVRPERLELAGNLLKDTPLQPKTYGPWEDAWHGLCGSPDVDLVYICTPWSLHAPMAVRAMEEGKHAAVEVPAATTVDDCWRLVETSEQTRRHCMMLENSCYDFFELLTLKMAREGFFGEIIHAEGAYIHDLRKNLFDKSLKYDMWRLKENVRNGNLYPTHGLGPLCQIMNVNRGDRMGFLVSVSSDDFHLRARAEELAREDSFYEPFAQLEYRGNMNTSTIRTHRGRTIMIQHDVTSPRPYSRIHLISGTKAMARKYPSPLIAVGHEWATPEEFKALEEKYTPELVRTMGETARRVGGHGGMDFLMDWRLIEALRRGLPLDQDVYDAALWSAIGPLSEWSVARGSQPIAVPDFTRGSWQNNLPLEI